MCGVSSSSWLGAATVGVGGRSTPFLAAPLYAAALSLADG